MKGGHAAVTKALCRIRLWYESGWKFSVCSLSVSLCTQGLLKAELQTVIFKALNRRPWPAVYPPVLFTNNLRIFHEELNAPLWFILDKALDRMFNLSKI